MLVEEVFSQSKLKIEGGIDLEVDVDFRNFFAFSFEPTLAEARTLGRAGATTLERYEFLGTSLPKTKSARFGPPCAEGDQLKRPN